MKSTTLFVESLFNIEKDSYTPKELKDKMNHPYIKEFYELSKKILIDKVRLTKQEKERLIFLHNTNEVEEFLRLSINRNKTFWHKLTYIVYGSLSLSVFQKILGAATPLVGLNLTAPLLGLSLIGIIGVYQLYGENKDRRKIKKELTQIKSRIRYLL